MDLVDIFCGVGGFSAGAMSIPSVRPIFGVDCDDAMVRLWSANTNGNTKRVELWEEHVNWPTPRKDLHVHLSPPCTDLSNAKQKRSGADVNRGLYFVTNSVEFLIKMKYKSWSIETVSTPTVRAHIEQLYKQNPSFDMSWTIVDASNFNTPSSRKRLIIGNSQLIQALLQTPPLQISVEEAFTNAGMEVPARYIRNNTRTKKRKLCVRSVLGPAHTQTASHPLTWCNEHGETVRCLTIKETAIIMGFPEHWQLPVKSRDAIKALGNSVPPGLSKAIMAAAMK